MKIAAKIKITTPMRDYLDMLAGMCRGIKYKDSFKEKIFNNLTDTEKRQLFKYLTEKDARVRKRILNVINMRGE